MKRTLTPSEVERTARLCERTSAAVSLEVERQLPHANDVEISIAIDQVYDSMEYAEAMQ